LLYIFFFLSFLKTTDLAFSYEGGKIQCGLKDIPYHFVCTGGGPYVGSKGDNLIPWLKQTFSWVQKKNQTYFPVAGTLSKDFDLVKFQNEFEKQMEKEHKSEFKAAEKQREKDAENFSATYQAKYHAGQQTPIEMTQ